MLPLSARNYFLGAAGRRITYMKNKNEFDKIDVVPRMLRDVSKNTLETSTLGIQLDFPIGLSPVALHKLADPRGELSTVEVLTARVSEGKAIFGSRAAIEFSFGGKERPAQRGSN
ncbi:hydroxyacid oxidase 1 [Trichonephila clavipes]|nr:hydroxyacid oxidase 1 [Trichonephila clavipes]